MRRVRAEQPNQLLSVLAIVAIMMLIVAFFIVATPEVLSEIVSPITNPCQSTELLSQTLLCR